MKQPTAIQVSILLWLYSQDESIKYIAKSKDITELYNMRLITTHLSGAGFILSQKGQEMVNKILSLFNNANHLPSKETIGVFTT